MRTITFFLVLLCAVATTTSSQAQAPQDDSDLAPQFQQVSKYQFTIGYSNDNVIMASVVDAFMEDGIDDYVTTSFWSQLAIQGNKNQWFVDATFDVLTNRQELYRTDLVTLRAATERSVPTGVVRFGGGFALRGRYGGSAIQNAYHNLTSIATVDLPYIRNGIVAPMLDGRYTTNALRGASMEVEGYASTAVATAAAPSRTDAGVVVACCSALQGKTYSMQLQGRFGYVNYFHLDDVLSPMYGKGFNSGLLASIGRKQSAEVAFWITRNQYGVGNLPQFGMSIVVGWNGVHTRINR